MYLIKTKQNKFILTKSQEETNKLLDFLGSAFQTIQIIGKNPISTNKSFLFRLRKADKEKYMVRAKDLGLRSLSEYIKLLLKCDGKYKLFRNFKETHNKSI